MSELHATLVTPEKTVFELELDWIQIPAMDGYVGILPDHAPFVSLAGTGVVTCKGRNKQIFTMAGGYFDIHNNQITILADVAEQLEDIDLDRAEIAQDRALQRIFGETEGQWQIDRAKAALLRSLNRIHAYKTYRNPSSSTD